MWSLNTGVQYLLGFFGILMLLRWLVRRTYKSVDKYIEICVQRKTVVITGANTGLGRATALELADRGAHVVLACRDENKAENAVKWIRKKTLRGELICMKLDLSSLHSIRQFCNDFKSKHDKIHILINNAGILVEPGQNPSKTNDGFEIHMGVNHLGHFLLTNLLLDLLKNAAPSRIVIVSSFTHNYAKLNLHDLMHERTKPPVSIPYIPRLYSNSKLANVLFNKELGKSLKGSGVNCYALCPGIVATEIERNSMNGIGCLIRMLLRPVFKFVVMKTAEEGAQPIIHCALNKNVSNQSGEMYRNCEYWDPKSRVTLKDEDSKKLWEVSEKLVGLDCN